jgi:hypothetical protein
MDSDVLHLFSAAKSDYSYSIEAHGHNVQTMELPAWKTHIKMRTTPGQWYTVWVRAIAHGKCFAEAQIQFKASWLLVYGGMFMRLLQYSHATK